MAKYQVEMKYSDGITELDDEVFTSKRDAEEHGLYLCGCYRTGCEILNISNPGDYPKSTFLETMQYLSKGLHGGDNVVIYGVVHRPEQEIYRFTCIEF